MIRIEVGQRSITIHGDGEGFENLATAAKEAAQGNKVFLGDPDSLLILRPEGFAGKEERDA